MGPFPFRYPRLALIAILLLGLALRAWGITTSSMTHYDEFYYAQSGLDLWIVGSGAAGPALESGPAEDGSAPLLNGLHPLLPFHAPPGYPMLIALVHAVVGGPWYPAGALVSALVGTATIALMYLFAKRFTGSETAGLAAAALLALSDFHIAYSRMWLTDATFCFVILLAMYCFARLFEGGRVWWAVAASLATGLAWNVKYNGWMPAAIGLAAWIAVYLRAKGLARSSPHPLALPLPLRTACVLTCIAALTIVLFLPWFLYVQRNFEGGYATVQVHHSSFSYALFAWKTGGSVPDKLYGVARAWFLAARHLLEALPVFRHWGWCCALGGGVVGAVLCFRRSTGSPGESQRRSVWSALGYKYLGLFAVLWLSAALMGLAGMLFLAGIAAGLACLARGRPVDVLVAVWLAAFLVLVPAYHAYPRLLLPALPAAILALLRVWQCMLPDPDLPSPPLAKGEARRDPAGTPSHAVLAGPAGRFLAATGLAVVVGGTLAAGRVDLAEMRGVWSTWTSIRSYRAFRETVAPKIPANALLLCRTQPPLWYALPREFKGLEDHPLPEDLPRDRPIFLVLDFYVRMTPNLLASIESQRDRLQEVARTPNDLTPPARLNLLTRGEFSHKMRVLAGAEAPAPVDGFLPPPLQHPGPDWIILYRMDAPRAP